jgi:hypothetical protein
MYGGLVLQDQRLKQGHMLLLVRPRERTKGKESFLDLDTSVSGKQRSEWFVPKSHA